MKLFGFRVHFKLQKSIYKFWRILNNKMTKWAFVSDIYVEFLRAVPLSLGWIVWGRGGRV